MTSATFVRASGGKASSIPLMGGETEPSLFELSAPGRAAASFRTTDVPQWTAEELIPTEYLHSQPTDIVEVSERDLTAHFTRLTHRQYAVDLGAYPLGSCTMKYNPKVCDEVAALPGLTQVHPSTPVPYIQGWLELLVTLEEQLCEVVGMAAATLQPPAGAAGELTGLLIMRAFHAAQGRNPTKIIIPDSAHGTNPASVTLGGYTTVTIPSDDRGCVDLEALKAVLDDDVAGIMLTNPNTLGLFEEDIAEVAKLIHSVKGLLYYDGANLNAIMGVTRPGDMGFDIVHMNLHKTFAVPHGGGGPGSGPVAVAKRLVEFLPGPRPVRSGDAFDWETPKQSIGRLHGWHGNSLANARAFSYILLNGGDGLRKVSEAAVLNANWLRKRLHGILPTKFDRMCMHEFVATASGLKKAHNVRALDVAKLFIDGGFHPPTVYFPLIVEEALMIEPTETESLDTLEALAEAIEDIVTEVGEANEETLEALREGPFVAPVRRVDETRAARELIPTYDARP